MAKSDITKRPKRKGRDILHTLAKAGISVIPNVGGTAKELLSLVITPSLEKRRDEWIESIAEELKKLEGTVKDFKYERLCENENFVTNIFLATKIALQNHQKEKLDALRNAVLSSAINKEPEENLQLIFMNLIDELTTWHLRVLAFFDNPYTIRGGSIPIVAPGCYPYMRGNDVHINGIASTIVEKAVPEMKQINQYKAQIIRDLINESLLNGICTDGNFLMTPFENKPSVYSDNERYSFDYWITPLGEKFIRYISSPTEGLTISDLTPFIVPQNIEYPTSRAVPSEAEKVEQVSSRRKYPSRRQHKQNNNPSASVFAKGYAATGRAEG